MVSAVAGAAAKVTGVAVRDLAGDGAAVAELTGRVWRHAYGGRMWFPLWDEAFCRWQLPPQEHTLHAAAYDGERLVGCFCSVPHTLRIRDAYWPISLSSWCTVDPDYRVHGLAARLTEALEDRHAAAGLAFSLGIVSGDPSSLAFRMWSNYARLHPDKMRFLFRIGYWAKLLDPRAMGQGGLSRGERWGARLLGPALGASMGRAAAWRPYRARDLAGCARLLAASTRDLEWAIEWPEERLARQLGGEGVQTLVAEDTEGIRAVASVARLDFHGRGPLRGGVIDLWATRGRGIAECSLLLGGICRRLRAEGMELLLAQRSAMNPAAAFAASGFLPLPAQDHLVALFTREMPSLERPASWSLLFR